jgi:hypothetical protein
MTFETSCYILHYNHGPKRLLWLNQFHGDLLETITPIPLVSLLSLSFHHGLMYMGRHIVNDTSETMVHVIDWTQGFHPTNSSSSSPSHHFKPLIHERWYQFPNTPTALALSQSKHGITPQLVFGKMKEKREEGSDLIIISFISLFHIVDGISYNLFLNSGYSRRSIDGHPKRMVEFPLADRINGSSFTASATVL